ncbi:MAG TPA: T9SS type A sorting domain-containing protein [Bacteroidia bacterium]
MEYSINTIGVYFSKTAITSTTTSMFLPYIPQIQNKPSNSLTDKVNWILVSDTLTANGGEQYITIGNFMRDSLSDTLHISTLSIGDSYYYIDDVSVIDVATIGIKQETIANYQLSVYPNPTNDILQVVCNLENAELTITDVLGNVLMQQKMETKTTSIDVSNLSESIYFIQVKTKEGVLTKKIVVKK